MNVTGEISAYLAKVAVKTSFRIGAKGIIADTTGEEQSGTWLLTGVIT